MCGMQIRPIYMLITCTSPNFMRHRYFLCFCGCPSFLLCIICMHIWSFIQIFIIYLRLLNLTHYYSISMLMMPLWYFYESWTCLNNLNSFVYQYCTSSSATTADDYRQRELRSTEFLGQQLYNHLKEFLKNHLLNKSKVCSSRYFSYHVVTLNLNLFFSDKFWKHFGNNWLCWNQSFAVF